MKTFSVANLILLCKWRIFSLNWKGWWINNRGDAYVALTSTCVVPILKREIFANQSIRDLRKWHNIFIMSHLEGFIFGNWGKNACPCYSNRVELICWKKDAEVVKKLNLVFSIPCLYTKYGNSKHKAYAMAFSRQDFMNQ